MNAKERYNKLINDIEAKAGDEHISASELVLDIAKMNGMDVRELNSVFKFLIDKTVLAYVKERKLMSACQTLIKSTKSRNKTINLAIGISGFNDHSSFDRAFTKFFKTTPTDVIKKKDESIISRPMIWEETFQGKLIIEAKQENNMSKKMKFGIPENVYNKVIKAHQLEIIYNFSPMYSEVAFELSEKLSISLTDAFKFADVIRDYGGEFDDEDDCYDNDGLKPEERMREIACDTFIQCLYFEYGLSPEFAFELQYRCPKYSQEELKQMDKEMIKSYAMLNEYILFDTYKAAYEYYYQNANEAYEDEDFENYLDYIYAGMPKEEAFNEIIPSGELYDYCDENAKISDMLSDVLDLYEDDNEYFTSNEYIEDFNEDEYYYDEDIEDKGMVEECYFDKYFGEDEI